MPLEFTLMDGAILALLCIGFLSTYMAGKSRGHEDGWDAGWDAGYRFGMAWNKPKQ